MRPAPCRLGSLLRAAVILGGALLASSARAAMPTGASDPVPLAMPAFQRAEATAEAAFRSTPEWRALGAEAVEEPGKLLLDGRTGAPGVLRLTVPLLRGKLDAESARAASEAFLSRHAALLRVDPATLAPPRVSVLLEGRLITVDFGVNVRGVPVEAARVGLRIVRGNLVLVETERLVDPAAVETTPLITLDEARSRVQVAGRAAFGPYPEEAALRILPRESGPRLAWRLRFSEKESIAGWEAWIDARDGAVLALFDANEYACPPPAPGAESHVVGGILPTFPTDAESVRGIPYSKVTLGGTPTNTDFGGHYTYPGGSGDATFAAPPAFTTCVACSNPVTGAAPVDTATGSADFGVGGADTVGNGISLKAERTAFYHACRAHDFARKWLPQADVIQNVELRVNPSSIFTCNAAWRAPAIYLLREGGGCINAGEHPGVIQHEWGHGLDSVGGPFGDWGEGMADHLAWLTNRRSQVAPGFSMSVPDTLLREMDEDLAPTFRAWPAPECGGEVHCLGEVYGQADWHLCRLLRQDPLFGEEAGWHLMEAIFFLSETQAGNIAPDQPGAIYECYADTLEALFGDGNTAAGVPLASHLNAAYSHHGMAPAAPYPEETYPCGASPVAPMPTAQVAERDPSTGHPKVTLTWTDPLNVAHDVVRSDDGASYSKLLLATVPAGTTTFTDAQVMLGARYWYVVIPRVASGCIPRMDNILEVLVQSGLSLESVDVDLAGDGRAAPGETIDVRPHVRNDAGALQTGVVAMLEPGDPRATILQDTSTLGDIIAGRANVGSNWTIQLDADPSLCGQSLDFPVRLTSNEGCWESTWTLVVDGATPVQPVGDALRVSRVGDDAVLDWSLTTSTSTTFNIYRRVSARQFPATGAMSPLVLGVASRTFAEADGLAAMPLAFYLVKAIDDCGNEEP